MVAKQRILIVDDDENIAELISLYLTKECFETHSILQKNVLKLRLYMTAKVHLITFLHSSLTSFC